MQSQKTVIVTVSFISKIVLLHRFKIEMQLRFFFKTKLNITLSCILLHFLNSLRVLLLTICYVAEEATTCSHLNCTFSQGKTLAFKKYSDI